MKNVLRIISVLSLGVLLSFSLLNTKKVVVIDAGHGGKDYGINRDGFVEKDIVLQVAKKIKGLNKNPNLEIILTRDDDTYPTLSERTDLVNKINPNLTLSLHINSVLKADSEKKGAEVLNFSPTYSYKFLNNDITLTSFLQ
jgi:N-acetylmuramoyl-L-alanine amidase